MDRLEHEDKWVIKIHPIVLDGERIYLIGIRYGRCLFE